MDYSSFPVATYGDSREREAQKLFRAKWPSYEPFWQRHIVPLSFRIVDRSNPYIRPSLSGELVDLANRSYATMFHLTSSVSQGAALIEHSHAGNKLATDALYAFFTHLGSLKDALLYFAIAVDAVVEKYSNRRGPFQVQWTRPDSRHSTPPYPVAIGGKEVTAAAEDHKAFACAIRIYRNQLTHSAPFHPLRPYLPRAHVLKDAPGLVLISRIARDGLTHEQSYEGVEWAVCRYDSLAVEATEQVWYCALRELDRLQSLGSKYEHAQQEVAKADSRLTRADIERFRGTR